MATYQASLGTSFVATARSILDMPGFLWRTGPGKFWQHGDLYISELFWSAAHLYYSIMQQLLSLGKTSNMNLELFQIITENWKRFGQIQITLN
jgi:hypothetical protein